MRFTGGVKDEPIHCIRCRGRLVEEERDGVVPDERELLDEDLKGASKARRRRRL
jgi:hypothetical protein